MSSLPAVRINRKGSARLESGHLWVFSSDVTDHGSANPGDVVRIVGHQGRTLGTAHYSSSSQITLRVLSNQIEEIDRAFLYKKIETALAHRKRVVSDSDAYRLVHAEGDLLPGLIVDRYGGWLVAQLLDQGMDRLSNQLVDVLKDLLNPEGIVARNDAPARAKENLPRETHLLLGKEPAQVTVRINGLMLKVDLLKGQKTGIFLDQRENYVAAAQYAKGRALDCFTGTGGFALHLASRCESVEGIDSSAASLQTAHENATENNLGNITFRGGDVLDYLPGLIAGRRKFNLIVVDPPAFTKSRAALEGAARGYKEINLRALRLLDRGGILVSCSCSHHMSEAQLLEIIAGAALDTGKQLRVLERRTQAQDHPILLTVPETHYLKCLIFEVL